MNILLFEYAMGSNEEVEPYILQEGKLMFERLLRDFLKSGFSITTLLNKKYKNIYKSHKNLNIYFPENDPIMALKEIIDIENGNIDGVLIIAPENDGILYNLTRLIEKENILNLGSHSYGIKVAGNKYNTYQKIKDTVKVPKTLPLKKYIIKEIDGCGGSNQLVFNEKYIIQEYIEGNSYSTSFIVQEDRIYPLSLNRQCYKEGKYLGGEININHPLKDKIIEESIKALKRIEGLNGYVGVDIMLDNEKNIYVLEVNPRITTSIVGLDIAPSLSNLLVDNAHKKDLNYKLNGSIKLIRDSNNGEFIIQHLNTV
ncbi:MAG TPA: ATP-grasp domain-containing protein [Methanothermococcus okinawensis]|uniref:ATP-grasp domain-containing protein n=1 Tax=Methanothermococcus okinawensis TaxID=155863 RepID=A0A832YTQ1_9EURY|nr:ATP-grasp domain-containing protein [Methanothermococcus okinawensis]